MNNIPESLCKLKYMKVLSLGFFLNIYDRETTLSRRLE